MPEGHTIHRLALDQGPLLVGRPLRVSSPQGRFTLGAARLDGRTLDAIEAYGKHLFYDFGGGDLLHVHLGLFGKFRMHHGDAPEPRGAVRLRLATGEAAVDLAGPTDCSLGTPDDRDAILARLGPDPLRRDAEVGAFTDRVARSRAPLGALLLDQSVIAGVGNVYRAEALFVTGIHPLRTGRETSDEERAALWATVRSMLRQGVKDGRIVTVDPRELGTTCRRIGRDKATYAYKRATCLRCSTPILAVELAGRPCYFCPFCQPR